MPIYEFYCAACHTIFSFLSKTVCPSRVPKCPKCAKKLRKQVSMFSMGGSGEEQDDMDDLPIDESKMESAMEALASEAEGMNEDDPRAAARLMRKFSSMTGMEFGEGMEAALSRLEAGEDPDAVEAEMGDIIENEEPFVMGSSKRGKTPRKRPLRRDETLYEM